THVGEVILTWNHEQQAMVKKEAYAINITHLPKDEHTDQLLTKYEREAKDKLQQPVAQINTPLKVDWFNETELIQKLTHVLKNWTHTDVAMLRSEERRVGKGGRSPWGWEKNRRRREER